MMMVSSGHLLDIAIANHMKETGGPRASILGLQQLPLRRLREGYPRAPYMYPRPAQWESSKGSWRCLFKPGYRVRVMASTAFWCSKPVIMREVLVPGKVSELGKRSVPPAFG
jgi:hypothetical protein